MIESVIALFFVLVVFLFMVDLLQGMKAKILVEYAAAKCARARAVGYNDFMLTKIARLSTIPVAGRCNTQDYDGSRISRGSAVGRMGSYLASEYDVQADSILDFEYWQDGRTSVETRTDKSDIEVIVTQRRPAPFFDDAMKLLGLENQKSGNSPFELRITGRATTGNHYSEYLTP